MTLAAQLANAKTLAERRLTKIREQALEIETLREYKAELEECLAMAREKLWDQFSVERINGVLRE